MRRAFIALAVVLIAPSLFAQRLNLDFPALAERASETVDVTLDGPMLRLAAKFLSSEDAGERDVREMVRNLEGIYVRSYTFDKEGEYDRAFAGKVRAQLGASWKKIVNVQSRERENVEIFVDSRPGDRVNGLLIISAEPREFTIVNIVGPVDLEKLSGLEGQFGIPRISKKEKEHE